MRGAPPRGWPPRPLTGSHVAATYQSRDGKCSRSRDPTGVKAGGHPSLIAHGDDTYYDHSPIGSRVSDPP